MLSNELEEMASALAQRRQNWKDKPVRKKLHELRANREFSALAELAERAARFRPNEPELRRLQAQALIDTGQPATAVNVIEGVRSSLPDDHPELAELQGLLGRAYKQMLVEGGESNSVAHKSLLKQAMSAYRIAYRAHPERYWHGVNLLALSALAQRRGFAKVDPQRLAALANRVLSTAGKAAELSHDPWAYATVAEASVALDDPAGTEAALRKFLNAAGLEAFHVGSLLRQLVQVWRLDQQKGPWEGSLALLRATHASMPGADATLLSAHDVQLMSKGSSDLRHQFERVLGPSSGLVTYQWWQLANQRAMTVAAVRNDRDRNIGTAFAVAGSELIDLWAGQTLVLTNYHVVNREGVAGGLRPDDAELVFEAVDLGRRHAISRILWESPPHEFDCAVLLLDQAPPLTGTGPLAKRLPLLNTTPASRVYIIGHPDGRGLEFSINDNELLDHDEGSAAITRLHYRAPTEFGSSGSPVFNEGKWQILAIHHAYTESRLKGQRGTYAANEGIGLQSVRAKLDAIKGTLPALP